MNDNLNILKDINHYWVIKSKFRKYNKIWKDYIAPKNVVGDNSWLYMKYKPMSYQDFFNKYIDTDCNIKLSFINGKPKKDQHLGRSIGELYEIAEYFKTLTNDPLLSVEEHFDCIVLHTIIETFNGHFVELNVKTLLENKGFTVINECGEKDSKHGIDFTIYKNNEIYALLQVKPNTTFFGGNDKKDLVEDRKRFYENDINKKRKFYILYDSSSLISYNRILWFQRVKDQHSKFRIQELCDSNGYSIINPKDFRLVKIV